MTIGKNMLFFFIFWLDLLIRESKSVSAPNLQAILIIFKAEFPNLHED